jgi:ribonuclease BN (tRNA processing enzyme)
VEVRTDAGGLIILDAGTGLRELGASLMAQRGGGGGGGGGGVTADIFLTHAHWDHIQGLPFFAPIFEAGNRFTIFAPAFLGEKIETVVRGQMSSVVFPVTFDQLSACVDFREIGEERRSGEGYELSACAVHHPGGALGYRFSETDAPGRAFVYISDNELCGGRSTGGGHRIDQRVADFVRGAKVLVHDTTYTAAEYERHRGWGHSTYDDAVALALDAGVETLVLYHHKPERSDDELDDCLAAARAMVTERGGRLTVVAAAEGMTVSV